MLESIKIEGFKNFRNSSVELKGLKRINVLVGVNGSGKSSVLELIAATSNLGRFAGKTSIIEAGSQFSNLYSLFAPKTKIVFSNLENSFRVEITPRTGQNWDLEAEGDFRLKEVVAIWNSHYAPFKGSVPNISTDPFVNIVSFNPLDPEYGVKKENRIEANAFLESVNKDQREIVEQVFAGKAHLSENRKEVKEQFLAGGTQYIATLISAIKSLTRRDKDVLLIDDLGDALFPALRKEVIPFLEKQLSNLTDKADSQCFCTTHNIEVVKVALDNPEYCSVYMFDYDGKLLEFKGTKKKIVTVSRGIQSSQAVSVVAEMLGFSDVDMGFPELVILAEEESKKTFLDSLKANPALSSVMRTFDILVPFQVGDGNVDQAINGLLDLSKYLFLSSIWSNRYVVFVDHNPNYYENGSVKTDRGSGRSVAALKRVQTHLGDNFLFTKNGDDFVDSLEETYPKELWESYKKKNKLKYDTIHEWLESFSNFQEKGKKKNHLAKFVGTNISAKWLKSCYSELSKKLLNSKRGPRSNPDPNTGHPMHGGLKESGGATLIKTELKKSLVLFTTKGTRPE